MDRPTIGQFSYTFVFPAFSVNPDKQRARMNPLNFPAHRTRAAGSGAGRRHRRRGRTVAQPRPTDARCIRDRRTPRRLVRHGTPTTAIRSKDTARVRATSSAPLAGQFHTDQLRGAISRSKPPRMCACRPKLDRLAAARALPEPAPARSFAGCHRESFATPREILTLAAGGHETLDATRRVARSAAHDHVVGRDIPPSSDRSPISWIFEQRYRFEQLGRAGRIMAIGAGITVELHPSVSRRQRTVSRLMSHADGTRRRRRRRWPVVDLRGLSAGSRVVPKGATKTRCEWTPPTRRARANSMDAATCPSWR